MYVSLSVAYLPEAGILQQAIPIILLPRDGRARSLVMSRSAAPEEFAVGCEQARAATDPFLAAFDGRGTSVISIAVGRTNATSCGCTRS